MENKKYLTLEEAENIVDNMYQKRWEECGVDDGNTIHMGNLDKLQYNELEKASILLLRTEIRLKKENKQLKEQVEYLRRSIERKEDVIKDLELERVPYTNKYVDKVVKENEILRKNAKHNDKVVDKVNWENNLLKKEKKEIIDFLEKEQDRLARECSPIYEDGLGKTRLVNEEIYNEVSLILSKIEKSDK